MPTIVLSRTEFSRTPVDTVQSRDFTFPFSPSMGIILMGQTFVFTVHFLPRSHRITNHEPLFVQYLKPLLWFLSFFCKVRDRAVKPEPSRHRTQSRCLSTLMLTISMTRQGQVYAYIFLKSMRFMVCENTPKSPTSISIMFSSMDFFQINKHLMNLITQINWGQASFSSKIVISLSEHNWGPTDGNWHDL